MAKETVRIKLNQSIAGHRTRIDLLTKQVEVIGEFAHGPGDEIEWDAAEAKKFIERGIASPAKQ